MKYSTLHFGDAKLDLMNTVRVLFIRKCSFTSFPVYFFSQTNNNDRCLQMAAVREDRTQVGCVHSQTITAFWFELIAMLIAVDVIVFNFSLT